MLDYNFAVNPAVVVDGNLNLHVCWHHNPMAGDDDIWYRKRELIGGEFLWIPPLDQDPQRVYWSPGAPSDQAFIETYGDSIFIVWSEEEISGLRNSRDIFEARDRVDVGRLPLWQVSSYPSPGVASESPVKAWREFCVWAEENPSQEGNHDIVYASPTWGFGLVYSSPTPSYHANSVMRNPPETFWDELFTLWSESPDQANEGVWFSHQVFGKGKGRNEPLVYYDVRVGGVKPSHYCLKRTGFRQYAGHFVDFAHDTLKYVLPFLNSCPKISYTLLSLVYYEGASEHSEEAFADDVFLGSYRFRPGKLETLLLDIPWSSYKNDRRVILTLVNDEGEFVSRTLMKLYQIERPVGGKGKANPKPPIQAGVASELAVILDSRTERARIHYSLRGGCHVIFRLYDVMGRCVKAISEHRRNKGSYLYAMDLTGLPNGVYVMRMETAGSGISKKIVVMK